MTTIREDDKGYICFEIPNQNRPVPTHPLLTEFLESINEKHSGAKYFTYRCATKLFEVQEFLQTNRIPYQLVLGILDRHRLQNASLIPAGKLKQIVFDIFYGASRLGYFLDTPNANTEWTKYFVLNLIWNIFDPKRTRSITVQELKQIMLILCESSCFQSKLYEYFDIIADHNQCIPRTKFECMLVNFARIFAFFDESANQFGSNWISTTVRDAYERCPGLGGLDNFQFLQMWSSPNGNFANFANILSLLQRLMESQYVLHGKRCGGCQDFPIKGLRFKCQRCRKLSLCLKCFSHGFISDRHAVSHKMLEISSTEGGSGAKGFLAKLCGKTKSHRMDGLENLEVKLIETETGADPNCTNSVKITSHSTLKRTMNKSMASNYFGGTVPASTNKTSKICDALAEQNERFLNNLNALQGNLTESQLNFLEQHYQTLNDHIKELRECGTASSFPFSSTPFRTTRKRQPLPNLNVSTPLLTSIQGAEINRSFIEENKSLSINDISHWLQAEKAQALSKPDRTIVDTKMANFKKLLGQVKEIVDDSYSDNQALATRTKMLENALDDIIAEEEDERRSKDV